MWKSEGGAFAQQSLGRPKKSERKESPEIPTSG